MEPTHPSQEPSGQKMLSLHDPFFFLGPCAIESDAMVFNVAQQLHALAQKNQWNWVFKASFDKANRTSAHSYRGVNEQNALRLFSKIKSELGIAIMTDVHSPEQAERFAPVVDVLQIPAFLCRQTDLIQAAAQTGRAVNVKKGQFLSPPEVVPIAEKLIHFGCHDFMFTERGTTFGYQNLVVDMRSLYWMKKEGFRVVFDATHAVQSPGGLGSSTGGDRTLAPVLARSAAATGCCDGYFFETHPNPNEALSDGPNQIPLDLIARVVESTKSVHKHTKSLDLP